MFLDVKILSLEDAAHLRAGTGEKTMHPFKALVDTGASLTCITKNVVGAVGL